MDHEDSIIEAAFHQYLTERFGEGWPKDLPEEVLGHTMPAFFAGAAIGMKIGREGGAIHARASVEVVTDLNYRHAYGWHLYPRHHFARRRT